VRILIALTSFILGACAATTVGHLAAARPAAVLTLEAAELRLAPNGKARIQHLARGDRAYLGRLEMEPGAAVPVHRDATEEYVHVLEGGGTIIIDGVEHAIAAGSTVFMPAGAEVSYTNGPARLVALQVFAGPEPAAKYEAWRAP